MAIHKMSTLGLIVLALGTWLAFHDQAKCGGPTVSTVAEELQRTQGFCIQIGIDLQTSLYLLKEENLLVHCLDPQATSIQNLLAEAEDKASRSSLIVEQWAKTWLPHAENLANLVVVNRPDAVRRSEIERVLRPGGVALFRQAGEYQRYVKPNLDNADEWTHQWHNTDGGLTTEDQHVGIPAGVQWLSGPLFAMAGRKSSTQTLVSAGGVNFYVTQNVLENVGQSVMEQYLVARDAFNGLVLWKRPWTGPFVTGNGETNPRMVASAKLLYAAGDKTLLGLDPKSGMPLAEFEFDQAIEKILLQDDLLLVQSSNKVVALDERLRKVQWEFRTRDLSALTIAGEHAYLLASGRSTDGRFKHELIRLHLPSGIEAWRINTQPHVTSARVRIGFVQDDFLALQAHGFLHMYSAADGRHLWTKTTDARPGKAYVDERYVGHFYRNGLVWMLLENSPRESLGQNRWMGLNPSTGTVERELITRGSWPSTATPAKMGCQLLIASNRYIMIPRQSTFIDFETGEKHSFKFTRGGCGLGFVPANGLVYSHPHACGCFSEAIRGFMGMHSREVSQFGPPQESSPSMSERLIVGFRPELEPDSESTPPGTSAVDWPIYRGDGQRSAFSMSRLSGKIQPEWSVCVADRSDSLSSRAWKLRTGNKLSASTVAGNTVFVADVDRGRLGAFDADNGQTRWTYQAAGRIDSPPTVWRGLCLFGSHDGYVYCLDANRGQLAWKFRAAPAERRIVAFGSLESAWPVAGSVLVREGVVYAAAGRAPDADGGIEVHALDALSGKSLWSQHIYGGSYQGLCDYLVEGKDAVYLSNWQFDPLTGRHHEAHPESPHLQGGKVGLLEASWSKHDLALRKEIQTWTAQGTSGQLIAFSSQVSAAYDAESHRILIRGARNLDLEIGPPRQVTALALTRHHLVMAGGNHRSDVLHGGFLQLVDLESGKIVYSEELPAEAAFDSLTIAGDRILVSTQDGFLHSFRSLQ